MKRKLFLLALCTGVVVASELPAAPPTADVSPGYDRRLQESRKAASDAPRAAESRHLRTGRSSPRVSKSRVRKKPR